MNSKLPFICLFFVLAAVTVGVVLSLKSSGVADYPHAVEGATPPHTIAKI